MLFLLNRASETFQFLLFKLNYLFCILALKGEFLQATKTYKILWNIKLLGA